MDYKISREVKKRIVIVPLKDAEKHHNIKDGILFGTRVNNNHELDGLDVNHHYGNPFLTDRIAIDLNSRLLKPVKGFGTVEQVCDEFREWLLGYNHCNIETSRREWIVNQIENGELDYVKFIYYRSCDREVSHLTVLLDIIIENRDMREESETTDWI